jgi:hypothetical protein
MNEYDPLRRTSMARGNSHKTGVDATNEFPAMEYIRNMLTEKCRMSLIHKSNDVPSGEHFVLMMYGDGKTEHWVTKHESSAETAVRLLESMRKEGDDFPNYSFFKVQEKGVVHIETIVRVDVSF